jgi:hypothetical protein
MVGGIGRTVEVSVDVGSRGGVIVDVAGGRDVLFGVGAMGLGITLEVCGINTSTGGLSVMDGPGVAITPHDDSMSNAISRVMAFTHLGIINLPKNRPVYNLSIPIRSYPTVNSIGSCYSANFASDHLSFGRLGYMGTIKGRPINTN